MYQLENDDSGHWYVIPSERAKEFYAWVLQALEDDPTPPDWAVPLHGAPNRVRFTSYLLVD